MSYTTFRLSEIIIRYSETGHSSRGLRYYFRFLLPKWKLRHQSVTVRTVHEQFEEPSATFKYCKSIDLALDGIEDDALSISEGVGESKEGMNVSSHGGKSEEENSAERRRKKSGTPSPYEVSLKELTPRMIEEVMDLYANSDGDNRHLRHGGPKVWSERRSIQGLWQPSLHGQLNALKWFHKEKPSLRLPKYSATSLQLSLQAIRGEGRWGSENEYPKGWDQKYLRDVFMNPFLSK